MYKEILFLVGSDIKYAILKAFYFVRKQYSHKTMKDKSQ